MKQYQTPSLVKTLFQTTNVIAVSGEQNIAAAKDSADAIEIQESLWNNAWN